MPYIEIPGARLLTQAVIGKIEKAILKFKKSEGIPHKTNQSCPHAFSTEMFPNSIELFHCYWMKSEEAIAYSKVSSTKVSSAITTTMQSLMHKAVQKAISLGIPESHNKLYLIIHPQSSTSGTVLMSRNMNDIMEKARKIVENKIEDKHSGWDSKIIHLQLYWCATTT